MVHCAAYGNFKFGNSVLCGNHVEEHLAVCAHLGFDFARCSVGEGTIGEVDFHFVHDVLTFYGNFLRHIHALGHVEAEVAEREHTLKVEAEVGKAVFHLDGSLGVHHVIIVKSVLKTFLSAEVEFLGFADKLVSLGFGAEIVDMNLFAAANGQCSS